MTPDEAAAAMAGVTLPLAEAIANALRAISMDAGVPPDWIATRLMSAPIGAAPGPVAELAGLVLTEVAGALYRGPGVEAWSRQ